MRGRHLPRAAAPPRRGGGAAPPRMAASFGSARGEVPALARSARGRDAGGGGLSPRGKEKRARLTWRRGAGAGPPPTPPARLAPHRGLPSPRPAGRPRQEKRGAPPAAISELPRADAAGGAAGLAGRARGRLGAKSSGEARPAPRSRLGRRPPPLLPGPNRAAHVTDTPAVWRGHPPDGLRLKLREWQGIPFAARGGPSRGEEGRAARRAGPTLGRGGRWEAIHRSFHERVSRARPPERFAWTTLTTLTRSCTVPRVEPVQPKRSQQR